MIIPFRYGDIARHKLDRDPAIPRTVPTDLGEADFVIVEVRQMFCSPKVNIVGTSNTKTRLKSPVAPNPNTDTLRRINEKRTSSISLMDNYELTHSIDLRMFHILECLRERFN